MWKGWISSTVGFLALLAGLLVPLLLLMSGVYQTPVITPTTTTASTTTTTATGTGTTVVITTSGGTTGIPTTTTSPATTTPPPTPVAIITCLNYHNDLEFPPDAGGEYSITGAACPPLSVTIDATLGPAFSKRREAAEKFKAKYASKKRSREEEEEVRKNTRLVDTSNVTWGNITVVAVNVTVTFSESNTDETIPQTKLRKIINSPTFNMGQGQITPLVDGSNMSYSSIDGGLEYKLMAHSATDNIYLVVGGTSFFPGGSIPLSLIFPPECIPLTGRPAIVVRFDHRVSRFILAMASNDPADTAQQTICMAISSDDTAQSWNVYTFVLGGLYKFTDSLELAVWNDVYIITYRNQGLPSPSDQWSYIVWVQRSGILTGSFSGSGYVVAPFNQASSLFQTSLPQPFPLNMDRQPSGSFALNTAPCGVISNLYVEVLGSPTSKLRSYLCNSINFTTNSLGVAIREQLMPLGWEYAALRSCANSQPPETRTGCIPGMNGLMLDGMPSGIRMAYKSSGMPDDVEMFAFVVPHYNGTTQKQQLYHGAMNIAALDGNTRLDGQLWYSPAYPNHDVYGADIAFNCKLTQYISMMITNTTNIFLGTTYQLSTDPEMRTQLAEARPVGELQMTTASTAHTTIHPEYASVQPRSAWITNVVSQRTPIYRQRVQNESFTQQISATDSCNQYWTCNRTILLDTIGVCADNPTG